MREPFERVVARHGRTVLRVCRAVLPPADAEDAWAETFLSALQAYPDLPSDANVEAWLVTIAHRKAIDATRRAARRPVEHVGNIEDGRIGDRAGGHLPDPAEAAAASIDLYAALATLPPRQRQALAYHHLAGLPHAEVAALIGGSAQASRRAAADGMATLRRRLSQPGGTP